jgi:AAA domain
VILSGDRGQHRSVERGDILAILEDRAGIRTFELSNIKRQQIAEYREAGGSQTSVAQEVEA